MADDRQNPQAGRSLKVDDALNYLDKVKQQFSSSPDVYNKFLEIMKEFKAMTIDTLGVINRVKELFADHPDLIVGFNAFLPPGYDISCGTPGPTGNASMKSSNMNAPTSPGAAPVMMARPVGVAPDMTAPAHPTGRPAPNARTMNTTNNRTGPNTGSPLEFEHAITFVTRIKQTFSSDTAKYKNFLDILQKYQNEKKTIKEVLDQVTVLLDGHPDLLRDFTYFLPDAVQSQARDRIERQVNKFNTEPMGRMMQRPDMPPFGMAASNNMAGMARGGGFGMVGQRGGMYVNTVPPMAKDREYMNAIEEGEGMDYADRAFDERELSMRERERERERERMVDRARDRSQLGAGPGRAPKNLSILRRRREKEDDLHLTITPSEHNFFNRVKAHLGSREYWVEFLKVLELFSSDILNKSEFLTLVSDIFPQDKASKAIIEEMKNFMNHKGFADVTPADIWYSMPVGEIDFSQCERCTPSYRHLPVGYPKLACSERSELDKSVLNDVWVSVPTGSEDFSFKIMRKNQYEDALFHCEDDRHDTDQVIDNNLSAIRVLEPLAEEISALREHSKNVDWQFRLDRRALGVLHLKAIARVYGEHGQEILELLRKNPAGAIPIILARLKAKDVEWRQARMELQKTWKRIHEDNFYRSLDHRSFYFKQADKRAIQPKNLLSEIRSKAENSEKLIKEFLARLGAEEAENMKSNVDAATAAGEDAPAPAAPAKKEGRDKKGDKDKDKKDDKDEEEVKYSGAFGPVSSFSAQHYTSVPLPAQLRATLRESEPLLHLTMRHIGTHKDAYALLFYAIEKNLSPHDRLLAAQLWRTFFAPFLQLPANWLQQNRLSAFPSGYGAPLADRPATLSPTAVLQIGDLVKTPYGVGVVADCRTPFAPVPGVSDGDEKKEKDEKMDKETASPSSPDLANMVMYDVLLDYGRAFLNADSVEAIPSKNPIASTKLNDVSSATQQSSSVFAPDSLLHPVHYVPPPAVPSAVNTENATVDVAVPGGRTVNGIHYLPGSPPPPSALAYLGSSAYVFLRLYQMMIDRLTTARLLCCHSGVKAGSKLPPTEVAAKLYNTGASATPVNSASNTSSNVIASANSEVTDVAAAVPSGTASSTDMDADSPGAVNAIVLSTGAAAPLVGEGVGETGVAVAAAVGDLTSAVIHDLKSSRNTSVISSHTPHSPPSKSPSDLYEHFLTSVFGAIDTSLDSSKFEDDSRELLGGSAFTLFSLEKLVVATAKQLGTVVNDVTTVRLANLWSNAVAKSTLAVKSRNGSASADAASMAAVANAFEQYRQAVPAVFQASLDEKHKMVDECYAFQYIINLDEPGLQHTASLSMRLLGKPVFSQDGSKSFQHADRLPTFLSRMVNPRKIYLGDEGSLIEVYHREKSEDTLRIGPFGIPLPPVNREE